MNGAVRRPIFRTYRHGDFDAAALAEDKARHGHVVSVCLPARDEAATVGPIVEQIRDRAGRRLRAGGRGPRDGRPLHRRHRPHRRRRRRPGARRSTTCCPSSGPARARARRSTSRWPRPAATSSPGATPTSATSPRTSSSAWSGPLLTRSDIAFVKGFYDRPVDGSPHGGGRVTELMARPVIAALFPHLASIVQPLSGEYAGRRSLLERLPFVQGYGVDLGLLIDIADAEGTEAIAQVDLGLRRHRNRSLEELGPQALAVLQTGPRPRRRRRRPRPPPSCGPISSRWRCGPTSGPPSSTSPPTAAALRRLGPVRRSRFRVGRSA